MSRRDGCLTVLVNPAARDAGAAGCRRLAGALEAHGIHARLQLTAAPDLPRAVSELLADGATQVAVGGGDGTVRGAAERLVGRDAALAVLPLGTLNHFARRLGIGEVDAAVAALARGTTRTVPVGVADDRVFLNTATFGQYAAVVRQRDRMKPWIGKWPAAGLGFARALRRLRPLSLSLDTPDARLDFVSPLLWAGVGGASFPRAATGQPGISGDELEIVITRITTRRAALALMARLLVHLVADRGSMGDRDLEVLNTRSLAVLEPRSIESTLDGEIFQFAAPVPVTVRPNALRVVTGGRDGSD